MESNCIERIVLRKIELGETQMSSIIERLREDGIASDSVIAAVRTLIKDGRVWHDAHYRLHPFPQPTMARGPGCS